IEAIAAGIECAVEEPSDMQIIAGKRNVFDLRIRPDPIETFALLPPKTLRIFYRAAVHRLIPGLIGPRMRCPVRRHRKDLMLRHGFLLEDPALPWRRSRCPWARGS